nr:MAG TPA: hypothetical protein [Caudoviricetes sp.]
MSKISRTVSARSYALDCRDFPLESFPNPYRRRRPR